MRTAMFLVAAILLLLNAPVTAQTYSGHWEVTPCVEYYCESFGFPMIDYIFCSIHIIDDYPSIQLIPDGAYPGPMSGAFSSPTEFSAELVYPSGCTERYIVEGTFISPSELTVVFQLLLSGQDCGITTCTDQTWQLSGSRFVPTCCIGEQRGDANLSGGSPDLPTIGDISAMIDAKFISSTCGPRPGETEPIIACLDEADVNATVAIGSICDHVTIGDISLLIDYLFITGPTAWDDSKGDDFNGYFPTGEGKLRPCP